MAEIKRQTRYVYETCEQEDALILTRIKVEEVYEITYTPTVVGKTNANSMLIDMQRTVLNKYVLHSTTAERVAEWRQDPEARGIIWIRKGQLYACPIESKDMKRLESYAHTNQHLCGANCKCICPKDATPCAKILNVKCNHIERYDFITDGYELFAPHQQSIFYVIGCVHYKTSSNDETD